MLFSSSSTTSYVIMSSSSVEVFDVEGVEYRWIREVDTIEEDSIGVNMLESTTLDILIGGSGCKTVAALEGSSSVWVDEDDNGNNRSGY
ncbi:hypothetical protein TNCV_2824941 [Trichonephila clavipes]|nr:hypothetical protein TNCV_2824941 [Trichonephila clavipes]